jgi:hypothetical protein
MKNYHRTEVTRERIEKTLERETRILQDWQKNREFCRILYCASSEAWKRDFRWRRSCTLSGLTLFRKRRSLRRSIFPTISSSQFFVFRFCHLDRSEFHSPPCND